MITDDLVTDHYSRPDLGAAIAAGLEASGLSVDNLSVDDLAMVDEFHTGGRGATDHLLNQLDLTRGDEVLDVGCGIGGAARYCANTFGTSVAGVDLTPAYVAAARQLTEWVGLSDRVAFHQGDGAALPFKKHAFDAGYLLHVGMNVADKTGLFATIAHVLRPGARFGVYDLMRLRSDNLAFPLPWASVAATSFLSSPDSYQESLGAAGFEIISHEDRTETVLEFMSGVAKGLKAGVGPPPLGLHLLMGPEAGTKLINMVEALEAGILAPVEIVAATPHHHHLHH